MRTALLLALMLSVPALAAPAVPVPEAATLEAGLAGHWQGTLGYRDYQSNQLQEIPMQSRIEALADGSTVIRVSTFDDGPRVGNVFITTASLHDRKAGTVTSTTLRRGQPVESITEQLRVASYTDAAHWTLVAEADGRDDDAPARLRTTTVRDGDTITATKEVQPASTGPWQFRNRSRLVRLP